MSDPGLRPFFQDIALTKLKNKLVSFLAFAFAPSSECQPGIGVHASINGRACRLPAMRLCAAIQAVVLDHPFPTNSSKEYKLPASKHELHACTIVAC